MEVLQKRAGGVELIYTRIGLGLAALGRPGYINLGHATDLPVDHDKEAIRHHAVGVLDAAWDAGIRYFDAARSYGAAEEFLATWLRIRQIDPAAVTIGSKWGYTYTADWNVDAVKHEIKRHDLQTLRRQMGETGGRLAPWLKLYQIHSATIESGVLSNQAVLDELGKLRDGGLVIGLSVTGVHQAATLDLALTVTVGGRPLFGSVQATWNLLERSAARSLQAAHDAGWLVIIKEGLANGRLTSRGMPDDSPLRSLSEQMEQPADALALAAIMAQPWVDVVLSGAATVEHLRSNIRALAIPWTAEHASAVAGMTEPAESYWAHRAQLPWN